MKNVKKVIQLSFVLLMLMSFSYISMAQDPKPPKSPKASVSQNLGIDTEIVISYSRPSVKGRNIWGELVPYGMNEGNKYSENKPYPWRAGANENTTITVSKDIKIEGKTLPAGKYSIHMVPGKDEFKIMFNKKSDAWGSYTYDASQNAAEVSVKPVACVQTEWLEFGFKDLADNGATAYLRWDKLEIPFKIQLP